MDFIGNPSPGFSILVSAPPKFGKSILCTEFAGYLARNHGKVLYVAKEEGLDDTLKAKLKSVAHPNLIVSDYLPDNMEDFDFVFLDSITRLRLSPYELNQLKENHPNISFIFVSQVTKAGKARGSNEFAHDVDSIIEFPERGRALQYGRFNQGGEMQVFDFSNN
ncbi:DNA repair protein RadA [compost metagenome]